MSETNQKRDWASIIARAFIYSTLSLIGLFLVVVTVESIMTPEPPPPPPTPQQVAIDEMRNDLRELSYRMSAAEKTGDARLAEELGYRAMAYMLKALTFPDAKVASSPMYYCHLSANHLARGAQSIMEGGSWRTRDVFDESLSRCSN